MRGIAADHFFICHILVQGTAQRYFKLDSRNGTLRLCIPLDREKQKGFTFRVSRLMFGSYGIEILFLLFFYR